MGEDGGRWGKMGGNGGKWGEMGGNGGNGGKWGKMKNVGKLPKMHCGECRKKCVKLVGNGRKIREKWDNLGQISQFPHCSTTSPPLPQVPLINFASRTGRLEKWEFRDCPTLADFSATADGWHRVALHEIMSE